MKKNLAGVLALAVVMVMGLAVGGVRPAVGGNEDNITICHAAGLAGTIQYVTLTISPNAVYGPAGHFNEDGTPQAGHEQDYFGACTTDTTTTTTTTTTDTETTTTTPRGVATAGAICIRALGRYNVFGAIDGVPALVDPETIPGGRDGPTLVNVYESVPADGQLVIVNTDGECVQDDEPPETTTTTPPGDRCPPGEFPTDGKDGEPGNEECEPPQGDDPPGTTPTVTTPTTTTDSTTIAETTTEETTTTTEEPTTTPPPVKAKPKPAKPNKPKKSTTKKTNKAKMPPVCPVGKPSTVPCAVQGSG